MENLDQERKSIKKTKTSLAVAEKIKNKKKKKKKKILLRTGLNTHYFHSSKNQKIFIFADKDLPLYVKGNKWYVRYDKKYCRVKLHKDLKQQLALVAKKINRQKPTGLLTGENDYLYWGKKGSYAKAGLPLFVEENTWYVEVYNQFIPVIARYPAATQPKSNESKEFVAENHLSVTEPLSLPLTSVESATTRDAIFDDKSLVSKENPSVVVGLQPLAASPASLEKQADSKAANTASQTTKNHSKRKRTELEGLQQGVATTIQYSETIKRRQIASEQLPNSEEAVSSQQLKEKERQINLLGSKKRGREQDKDRSATPANESNSELTVTDDEETLLTKARKITSSPPVAADSLPATHKKGSGGESVKHAKNRHTLWKTSSSLTATKVVATAELSQQVSPSFSMNKSGSDHE